MKYVRTAYKYFLCFGGKIGDKGFEGLTQSPMPKPVTYNIMMARYKKYKIMRIGYGKGQKQKKEKDKKG